MPDQHAILGPSSAKRWMTCSPSARAEQGVPEEASNYALEGTIAHECAEILLNRYRDRGECLSYDDLRNDMVDNGYPMRFMELRNQCGELGADFDEMLETVNDYYVVPVFEEFLDYRKEDKDAQLLVEAKLELDSFIPEGFGTSDAVIIAGTTLHVYDLKYGKGVKVEAESNPQMMCYALGVLYGPADTYAIETVKMTILQPRLKHHSESSLSWEELVQWGKQILRPAAAKAFKGEGEYVPGDHCKFCKVAPRCRACALRAIVVSNSNGRPELLTDDELSDVLGQVDSIESWAAKLKTYALERTLAGKPIPGWKAVEGRSVRKITDQNAALRAIEEAGIDTELVLKPKELKSLTDLERLLRKAAFNDILGPFITNAQGKPALAPESDRRPAYTPDTINDFNN